MNCFTRMLVLGVTLLIVCANTSATTTLDILGVAALRAVTTNLDGSGIRVIQAEASGNPSLNFEVNPNAVGQPTNLFTYYSSFGSALGFPNVVGVESGHGDGVAAGFYGMPDGVATNVAHVDNYDADFYLTNYVFNLVAAPDAVIANQSFTFNPLSVSDQQQVDSAYDDYEETFHTFFVSAANNYGNSAVVCAPGTAYNCISVGAYAGGNYYNSIGPTIDNGRCKPDITSLNGATSFSTPQVAGAAAVLMQAALRGDGGSDTNSAFDLRTIKALLLNGAVKPLGWTNSNSSPLDARYGAGVVNVLNAYKQLAGGKRGWNFSTNISPNAPHPPPAVTSTVPVLSGWDFNTNSRAIGGPTENVKHYFFNVSNSVAAARFTATATLVWNRQLGLTNINNLNLYLYNCANSNLVACSTSLGDNVEHICATNLTPGRYNLQVYKVSSDAVSDTETYALAWEFISPALQLAKSGVNTTLTWPAYPAGFLVETRTNLLSDVWTTNGMVPPQFTNGLNSIPLNTTNATQFFRLRKPNL